MPSLFCGATTSIVNTSHTMKKGSTPASTSPYQKGYRNFWIDLDRLKQLIDPSNIHYVGEAMWDAWGRESYIRHVPDFPAPPSPILQEENDDDDDVGQQ